MTLRNALIHGTDILTESAIDDAGVDARYLLEYVTDTDRTVFFMEPERELSGAEYDRYCSLIKQRAEHMPLQYLTNVQEFMGYDFYVNQSVLIPRQETELLVLEAEKKIVAAFKGGSNTKSDVCVLDMCTGSGCIAVSVKKRCPKAKVFAADISADAIEIAGKNADLLGAEISFFRSDLFDSLPEQRFDVIVSNPPYIESGEIDSLMDEVRLHEPKLALDGREDGLYFYRKIIEKSVDFLKPGGCILFEIGYNQGTAVCELLRMYGYTDIELKKDLAGFDRIVFGGMKNV